MIHVKADYDDPTSATISIRGLPDGWDNEDLRKGFVMALEALLAEAKGGEVPDIGSVRVAVRKNYEDADPTSAPTEAPDEPSVFDVSAEDVEAGLYVGIGEDAVRIGSVTGVRLDEDADEGPTLRVGSAIAGLGLSKVEDVDPVDIADAAFPDDLHLNMAVVKLLRLAELRMQYAAAGRKVSGRMDMQKLWDLDRDIARARREVWSRIGKEEKEYE